MLVPLATQVLGAWGASSSEGVLVFDGTGAVHLANARLADLLGISRIPPTILALLQLAEPAIPALRSVLFPAQGDQGICWGHLMAQSRLSHRLAWQRVPLEDAHVSGGTLIVFRDDASGGQLALARQSFLSTVSHDLRTPLSAIVGFAELMRNNVGSLTEDEQREFLEHIVKNANDLTRYGQVALDILFLEASPDHFELEDIFLASFVRHWLHDATHRFPTHQVTMLNGLEPDELRARASPMALHKILHILLEFALLESPKDGTIEIRLDQEGAEVHVVLRHQAPHMDRDDAGRLFALMAPRDLSEERRPLLHRTQVYVASLLAERQEGSLLLRQCPDQTYELDLSMALG